MTNKVTASVVLRLLGVVLVFVVADVGSSDEGSRTAASPSALVVTRTDDPVPDGCNAGDCSLREAIVGANATPGTDTIALPAGTYNRTLAGSQDEDASAAGDLDITESVSINGEGAEATIIDAANLGRVFNVLSGTVTISDVTIQNGYSSGSGGGISVLDSLSLTNSIVSGNTSEESGGGIYLVGNDLTLTDSVVSGNTAFNGGGVNISSGDALVTGTTISSNTATADGGGIVSSGYLTFIKGTVSGNATGNRGGGLYLYGSASGITNSTVNGNTALIGGGIVASSWAQITNTTVSGNTAVDSGGGIVKSFGDTAWIVNSTVSNNIADSGDGGGVVNTGGVLNLANTIVAANSDANGDPECFGALTSFGHNLIETVSSGCSIGGDGTGNIVGQEANLGPLTINPPGTNQTHAIFAGSPAIDAGSLTEPGSGWDDACEATDQRGVTRPQGAACDIGAFEVIAVRPTPTPGPLSKRWGVLNCAGPVTVNDPLEILASLAGIDSFFGPAGQSCPTIGDDVNIAGLPWVWGDTDCSGQIDPGDALDLFAYLAELATFKADPDCPDVGAVVDFATPAPTPALP